MQGYNLIMIIKMQQDGSHSWNTTKDRYRLFGEGQARTGKRESSLLCETVVGMHGTLPWDGQWASWDLMGQCQGAEQHGQHGGGCPLQTTRSGGSRIWGLLQAFLQAVVFIGDFNHPANCWKGSAAQHKQSGGLWSTLITSWHRWSRSQWGEMLCWTSYLQIRTGQECQGWSSNGCNDYEMMEIRILWGGNETNSRITALDVRRADLGLSRDLLAAQGVLS